MSTEIKRVTISLPRGLIRYADERAAALKTSRSALIGRALADFQEREQEALAREGYLFYGQEATEFSAASGRAVAEAIEDGR